MDEEKITMGDFIAQCNEKRKAKKESCYKQLAMVFGKPDYWTDAELASETNVCTTYIIQLNIVGSDTARSAIEYISPNDLIVKGGKPGAWYKIAPLSDRKFEIRFFTKEIDGTTDFLFQELVKDLCKQSGINYSDLFDSSVEEDESVYLADKKEEE